MLCQFSVKNFKSIRDEIIFDMQAAAISEHTDRVIKDVDNQLFLPVSSIYGPNGGGKSNVLEAIQTMGTLVLRPVHATKQNGSADYKFNRYPVKPFMLSEEGINNPTEFEIFFRTRVAEYKYALHADGLVDADDRAGGHGEGQDLADAQVLPRHAHRVDGVIRNAADEQHVQQVDG